MPANRLQRDDDRRLNLEQQRNRAKDLRHALQRGEADALARVRRHHPKAQGLSPDEARERLARLSDAQLVIARELGLSSWPKLKTHIERLEHARRAIAMKGPSPDGDRATVHIRCGSDIRARLDEAGFVGDFLEFSDPLWLGPLDDDIDNRARVISDACGMPHPEVAAKLRRAQEGLAAVADRYERIALWCEHDPYDQLFLARVLSELAERNRLPSIELLAIDRFPTIERFNGLGQLSAAALRSLWESRTPVAARQLKLGNAVWHALCGRSPAALGAIASGGTPELPIMAGALTRHLQELPWTTDGLSLTQRLALQALRDGPRTVSQLFGMTQNATEPLAFLGDHFFMGVLRNMSRVASPPFAIAAETSAEAWPRQALSLTPTGDALLSGTLDWMSLAPPERWVGGVCIAPGTPVWRWSAEQARPVLR